MTAIRSVRARTVAGAASVLCLLGAAGPPASGAPAHPAVAPPIPPVASVTELGTVVQNPVILGRDGNFSVAFGGKSIWTFGDTPLSVPNESGENWSDNTLSWTGDLDASDGITLDHDYLDSAGAPGEFLPLTDEEAAYNYAHDSDHCTEEPCGTEFALWNGPMASDRARNRVLFFYTEVWRRIGGPDWRGVGGGIATWSPGGEVVRPIVDPGSSTPTLMWTGDDVQYNSATLVVGPRLYAYGCELEWIVHHRNVARVRLARALDETQWRYYAGDQTWSADPEAAVSVFDGGAAGSTVLYSPYLGHYLAIYSGIYSNDVFYRAAETPWGPWSDQALLFTGWEGWEGNTNYAAEAHPEFAREDGRVQYVTYVHATGFLRWDLPLVEIVFDRP